MLELPLNLSNIQVDHNFLCVDVETGGVNCDNSIYNHSYIGEGSWLGQGRTIGQSFESILTGIDTDFQFGTSFQQLLAMDFKPPSSRGEDRGGMCQTHENPSLDITESMPVLL